MSSVFQCFKIESMIRHSLSRDAIEGVWEAFQVVSPFPQEPGTRRNNPVGSGNRPCHGVQSRIQQWDGGMLLAYCSSTSRNK
jgi:hypothetical protein